MAPRKPKVGDRFLAVDGPIQGTTVTVVEVVPPDVAGASAFLPDAPLEELRAARDADRGRPDAGQRAAEREAAYQDTAVLVEWEEPSMVADTSAEPRLVPVVVAATGEPELRPSGEPVTRAVWPMVMGTRNRRWAAALSTFRQQFQEA